MTSHYAFSPAYQGLYFDYTKEKTLSTLVNLRMFWRIKINCYRLNTWGVSQMEINIALLEHRRQAWNWKATWILNHFRFPKPFYFKEHDLSKQNFPIPSFSKSLKYIVLFHSKMSLQWGRLKEQHRSCVTQSLMEQRASPPLSLLRVCRSLGHHHRKQESHTAALPLPLKVAVFWISEHGCQRSRLPRASPPPMARRMSKCLLLPCSWGDWKHVPCVLNNFQSFSVRSLFSFLCQCVL